LPNIGRSGARFEAKSWEEVGRLMPNSNLYKLGVIGSIREVQNRGNVGEFDSQSHFYVGKTLRRGILWANYGRYAQLFSVSLVVLGS
jgi:hypothetical protein